MQNLSNPRKEAAAGKIVHMKKNKHDEGKTTRMNENTECKRGKSEGTRDPFYTYMRDLVHGFKSSCVQTLHYLRLLDDVILRSFCSVSKVTNVCRKTKDRSKHLPCRRYVADSKGENRGALKSRTHWAKSFCFQKNP